MKKLMFFLCLVVVGFASCQKDDTPFEEYLLPPEHEDPNIFYAYFRFVNSSGHMLLISFNDGGCIVSSGACPPGKALVYSKWDSPMNGMQVEPPFGLNGFIGFMFDPKKLESGAERGLESCFRRFDMENCPTPNPGDRTQWSYERLDDLHSRWTYVVTDADYEYALAHPGSPF